jgi:hypothetical protein
VFRRAGADDNDALLEFMREQSIEAGLSMRFERAPHYFALQEAHSLDHITWIVTRRGRIVSTASAVVRSAYVDRAVRTVAYFADLRQARGRGLAGIWRNVANTALDDVRHTFGATHAFCSILRGNRLARASILESRIGIGLRLRHLRGYRTVSIVGRLPWPRRRNRHLDIRHATSADSEKLRAFVDAQSRDRQFAAVFDRTTWQRRIEAWPDFGIEHFLIATDPRGRIVGCLAPWDSSTINRIVIDGLPFRAELLRRAANAAAFLTRRPKIPLGPATHLPDVALTHLSVENRDAEVFAELLAVAYRELMRTRRYATVSFCLYDGDPLWPALRHTVHNTVPMDLYWLPLDRNAAPLEHDALWPGFESYLV